MNRAYKIIDGGVAERFHNSRAKIRVYGGGFANGKTTGIVADTLRIARDYEGAAILLARATYPKLNSTLRREFEKWCPASWIKSFDRSKDNSCRLVNGTVIDFRYIEMKSGVGGEATSNLLSANYDFIGVDQIDDPEITYEDILQLLGRLRGSTRYRGSDPTMPQTGPRMMALTLNPTLGWPYIKIAKPLHDLQRGIINPDLLCERDTDGNMILINGKPSPIVELFEASTYDNAQNLEDDYIKTLEATYSGKLRDRYLLGKWVAFEGVVYNEWDELAHVVPHEWLLDHLDSLRAMGQQLTLQEAYDFGQVSPSCYMLTFTDADHITYAVDGFYEPQMSIDDQALLMKKMRDKYAGAEIIALDGAPLVRADPSIFKNSMSTRSGVGASVASMFYANDIVMTRGNNAKLNGIVKVKQKLAIQKTLVHPFTSRLGCPKFIISDRVNQWFGQEVNTYRWKRNSSSTALDEPVDGNDHAMDTTKYLFGEDIRPAIGARLAARQPIRAHKSWAEREVPTIDPRSHRYQ